MTKALLKTLKLEYEFTNITKSQLCARHNCELKDLKGHTMWRKSQLDSADAMVKSLYTNFLEQSLDYELESIGMDELEVEEIVETEPEVIEPEVVEPEVIEPEEAKIVMPQVTSMIDEDDLDGIVLPTRDELHLEVATIAQDIREHKPVDLLKASDDLQTSLAGLKKLDTKLQSQADRLLAKLDDLIDYVDTAKDLKDLVSAHTAIRDSYFNTKAPMVNILNGDMVHGDKNELATFLSSVSDDC